MSLLLKISTRLFPNRRDRYNLKTQKRAEWFARASAAVDLVQRALPNGGAIADVGCGDQKLRLEIERRGATYTYSGYDIDPQGADVIKFDLSSDELNRYFDVIVILGVLEYVKDVGAALKKLSTNTRFLVVSHVNSDDVDYSPERVRKMNWVSVLRKSEFEAALGYAGYTILERLVLDDTTRLWLCESLNALF
ncbi:methyltransferase domain-containing protein [Mesorhizobium sp. BAC0120]|uniref:class I SAM-dependent methyltransferase n=1 Tax=Mesorhizobium sp. BAC0120 TaxID=3090670 RepID=UPI00298C3173|nr:methyltransferase domain-containing protein [Mesorhizobium sp. BAC0120]MDW6022564.1 methyltransferase domain-containing protein [Mesorhizobium sp. BAC0120]